MRVNGATTDSRTGPGTSFWTGGCEMECSEWGIPSTQRNHDSEEPYAGNPLVRDCGGAGGQPPALPGEWFLQVVERALALALESTGSSKEARIPIMAITTSSSTSVKPPA
jgi:hypothetical protein